MGMRLAMSCDVLLSIFTEPSNWYSQHLKIAADMTDCSVSNILDHINFSCTYNESCIMTTPVLCAYCAGLSIYLYLFVVVTTRIFVVMETQVVCSHGNSR